MGDQATTWVRPQQVERLRNACYDSAFSDAQQRRNDAIVTLLYDTGLRVSELVDLERDSLDLEPGAGFGDLLIPVRDAHLGSDRSPETTTIPLDPKRDLGTVRLLASYLRERPDESTAVFPSRKGGHLTPKAVRDVVGKAAEVAEIRPYMRDDARGRPADVSPETLRHGTAWRMFAEGDATIEDVRERLRHTSTSTTKLLYPHFQSGRWEPVQSDPTVVFDRITDAFYALDDEFRFTYVNDRAERLLQHDERELLGESVWEIFPEATETDAWECFHRALDTQETTSYEVYFEPLEFWVSARVYPSPSGLSVYFRDVTEQKERERQLEQYRTVTEAANDAIVTIDEAGTIQSVNPAIEDVFGYQSDDIVGEPITRLIPDRLSDRHVEGFRRYLDTEEQSLDWDYVEFPGQHADGHEFPVAISFSEVSYGDRQFFTGIVRDITVRKEYEQELERRRAEVERTNQINALTQDIVQAIVEESTQSGIEQTVCEHLAASDLVESAWIGKHSLLAERVTPSTWAGITEDVLTAITGSTRNDRVHEFVADVVESRQTRVVDDLAVIADDDRLRDQNVESILAVPIEYEDTLYGVLVVCAGRAGAFNDHQRGLFADLGDTVGFAIAAIERKRALIANEAVELEVNIRDQKSFFSRATDRTGATLTLDDLIVRTDSPSLAYVTLTGASPEPVLDLAEQSAGVNRARLVERRDSESLLELAVTSSTVVETFGDHGGVVTDVTAIDGRVSIVVEFSPTADVGTVLDAVERHFSDADVIAKRTIERPVQADSGVRGELTDGLTDKQHTVLRAAYSGGYFDRPRTSSGEEVAASLGISPSTFHQHLRVAMRKLLAATVDE